MPMKTKLNLIFLVAILATTLSCTSRTSDRSTKDYPTQAPKVVIGDITFSRVDASAFAFNETPAGRLIDGAPNSFETIQSAFLISERPLDRAFYERFAGDGRWPKNGLSARDVNTMLDKAYYNTNIPIIIPTESMFEAAINTGKINISKNDDIILSDGWQDIREVQILPKDWKIEAKSPQIVLRKLYERDPIEDYRRRTANRFYLAIRLGESLPPDLETFLRHTHTKSPEPSDGKAETFKIGGTEFRMLPVKGGTMTLGATPEQEQYAEDDEAPLREVQLQDYKIEETEVTAGLWLEVMGTLPYGNDKRNLNKPVGNVSFYRAKEFVRKLSDLTGRPFRLPSEDEWEYAARGGVKTHGYVFSGGNDTKEVAVCSYKDKKKGETIRPGAPDIKSRRPNELGLYDMSGSQWEWVTGEMHGGMAVQKGGSWKSLNTACRVSNRQAMDPNDRKDTFGFRLAL